MIGRLRESRATTGLPPKPGTRQRPRSSEPRPSPVSLTTGFRGHSVTPAARSTSAAHPATAQNAGTAPVEGAVTQSENDAPNTRELDRQSLGMGAPSNAPRFPSIGASTATARANVHSYRHANKGGSDDSLPEAPAPSVYEDIFVDSDPTAEDGTANSEPTAEEGTADSQVNEQPGIPGAGSDQSTPEHADTPAGDAGVEMDSKTPGPLRPLTPIRARMPEYGRLMHDTPHRKVIKKGDQFLASYAAYPGRGLEPATPPSPISKHRFDIGFGRHTPAQSPVRKGSSWDMEQIHDEEPLAPLDEWWQAEKQYPNNRFLKQRASVFPTDSTRPAGELEANAAPSRQQPPRVASTQCKKHSELPDEDVFEEAVRPIVEESDCSDEEDAFAPQPGDSRDDSDDSDDSDRLSGQASKIQSKSERQATQLPTEDSDESDDPSAKLSKRRLKGKGKAPQRNASAGPSDTYGGRPTTETNQEIERVGHRIQGELVALAEKSGLSYDTLLRKIGLSHQGVREPTLGNVFRKVHKHRLLASGQGTNSHISL